MAAQVLGAMAASAVVYANYKSAITEFEGGPDIRTVPGYSETATAGIFCTYPQPFMTTTGQFFSEFVASTLLMFLIYALKDGQFSSLSLPLNMTRETNTPQTATSAQATSPPSASSSSSSASAPASAGRLATPSTSPVTLALVWYPTCSATVPTSGAQATGTSGCRWSVLSSAARSAGSCTTCCSSPVRAPLIRLTLGFGGCGLVGGTGIGRRRCPRRRRMLKLDFRNDDGRID